MPVSAMSGAHPALSWTNIGLRLLGAGLFLFAAARYSVPPRDGEPAPALLGPAKETEAAAVSARVGSQR